MIKLVRKIKIKEISLKDNGFLKYIELMNKSIIVQMGIESKIPRIDLKDICNKEKK